MLCVSFKIGNIFNPEKLQLEVRKQPNFHSILLINCHMRVDKLLINPHMRVDKTYPPLFGGE